ncbi:glycosyltransferase family 2 protein [Pseudarthrobacter sp. DSP2-3-2b1]|uniref:glycosyltransferase family 2 protein n=1 Tax=Pseudarthrobacter sp. DSP2-3-2b1 TaxID=2804661 RepID=UPI003CEA1C22
MKTVSVIVVTYNSANLLTQCVESLRSSECISEVIIWDNDSKDSPALIVTKLVEAGNYSFDITLHECDANIGFAKAVNSAADLTSGDYLLLLNPDCLIDGGGVDKLVHQLQIDSSIGVIAPSITHPSGRLRVKSAGFEPTASNMLSQALGLPQFSSLSKGFNLYSKGETGTSTEVDWVSGACLLMRADRWRQLEGLSERWFMYAEDIELCRRLRAEGLRVVHYGGVHSSHLVGASSEGEAGPAWSLWLENLYDYYLVNLNRGFFDKQLWKCAMMFTFLSRALGYRLKALAAGPSSVNWAQESSKFLDYARATTKLP